MRSYIVDIRILTDYQSTKNCSEIEEESSEQQEKKVRGKRNLFELFVELYASTNKTLELRRFLANISQDSGPELDYDWDSDSEDETASIFKQTTNRPKVAAIAKLHAFVFSNKILIRSFTFVANGSFTIRGYLGRSDNFTTNGSFDTIVTFATSC